MTKRKVLIGLTSAAGAFAITLALFAPGHLNATEPAARPTFRLYAPNLPLMLDGVEIKLEYAAASQPNDVMTLKPGDTLRMKLVAKNTSDDSAELKPTITVQETVQRSPFARTLPMPKSVWTHDESISLAPGERSVIEISPEVAVKAGTTLAIEVRFDEKNMRVLQFSVPGPQPTPRRQGVR